MTTNNSLDMFSKNYNDLLLDWLSHGFVGKSNGVIDISVISNYFGLQVIILKVHSFRNIPNENNF